MDPFFVFVGTPELKAHKSLSNLHLIDFLSRTTGPMSSKLGTMNLTKHGLKHGKENLN